MSEGGEREGRGRALSMYVELALQTERGGPSTGERGREKEGEREE